MAAAPLHYSLHLRRSVFAVGTVLQVGGSASHFLRYEAGDGVVGEADPLRIELTFERRFKRDRRRRCFKMHGIMPIALFENTQSGPVMIDELIEIRQSAYSWIVAILLR